MVVVYDVYVGSIERGQQLTQELKKNLDVQGTEIVVDEDQQEIGFLKTVDAIEKKIQLSGEQADIVDAVVQWLKNLNAGSLSRNIREWKYFSLDEETIGLCSLSQFVQWINEDCAVKREGFIRHEPTGITVPLNLFLVWTNLHPELELEFAEMKDVMMLQQQPQMSVDCCYRICDQLRQTWIFKQVAVISNQMVKYGAQATIDESEKVIQGYDYLMIDEGINSLTCIYLIIDTPVWMSDMHRIKALHQARLLTQNDKKYNTNQQVKIFAIMPWVVKTEIGFMRNATSIEEGEDLKSVAEQCIADAHYLQIGGFFRKQRHAEHKEAFDKQSGVRIKNNSQLVLRNALHYFKQIDAIEPNMAGDDIQINVSLMCVTNDQNMLQEAKKYKIPAITGWNLASHPLQIQQQYEQQISEFEQTASIPPSSSSLTSNQATSSKPGSVSNKQSAPVEHPPRTEQISSKPLIVPNKPDAPFQQPKKPNNKNNDGGWGDEDNDDGGTDQKPKINQSSAQKIPNQPSAKTGNWDDGSKHAQQKQVAKQVVQWESDEEEEEDVQFVAGSSKQQTQQVVKQVVQQKPAVVVEQSEEDSEDGWGSD